MAENDDGVVVVEDMLTTGGWRRVHFLCGDARRFQKAWDQRLVAIPWESADAVITQRYVEAGIEHGKILWPLRGAPVKYPDLPPGEGPQNQTVVMWVLFRKEDRVSQAIGSAAWYHYALYDRWPDTAWVGEDMAGHDGKVVEVDEHRIKLVCAGWMPKRGVGVGIRV